MKLQLVLALGLLACASAAHLEFSKGLDGWEYSDDGKYTGKFELATPDPLKTQALKVGRGWHQAAMV